MSQQEPTNNSQQKPSSEEERKKQFERMKERFSKNGVNSGGNKSPNVGGNNFYWIYGLIIVGLLVVTFYGSNFGPRMQEISQTQFEQQMLAKGDVMDINIVNQKEAYISINVDSLVKCNRYKDEKTGTALFPDKRFKGPHYKISVPNVEDFMRRVERVQTDSNIGKDRQVYPRSTEETSWMGELSLDHSYFINGGVMDSNDAPYEWWFGWSWANFQYRKIKSCVV